MGQREAWLRKSDRRLHRESGGDDDGGKLADDRHLGQKVDPDVHCFGNRVPPGLSRSVGAAATGSHAKRCRGSGSAHHSHREAEGLSASSHRHLSSNVDIWNSIFVNSEGRMDLVSSEAPLRHVLSWF